MEQSTSKFGVFSAVMIVAFISAGWADGARAQGNFDFLHEKTKVKWYKAPRGQGAEEPVDPASAYKKKAIADVSANYLRLASERKRRDYGSRDFFVIIKIAPNGSLVDLRIINVDQDRPIDTWTRADMEKAIRHTKFEKLGEWCAGTALELRIDHESFLPADAPPAKDTANANTKAAEPNPKPGQEPAKEKPPTELPAAP